MPIDENQRAALSDDKVTDAEYRAGMEQALACVLDSNPLAKSKGVFATRAGPVGLGVSASKYSYVVEVDYESDAPDLMKDPDRQAVVNSRIDSALASCGSRYSALIERVVSGDYEVRGPSPK